MTIEPAPVREHLVAVAGAPSSCSLASFSWLSRIRSYSFFRCCDLRRTKVCTVKLHGGFPLPPVLYIPPPWEVTGGVFGDGRSPSNTAFTIAGLTAFCK
jgi:hypothetical protein